MALVTPNPRKRLAHVLRQYSDPELLGDVAYVVAHTFGINEPPPDQNPHEHEHGFTQAIRTGDTEAILSYFPEKLPNDDIVNWFARELRKRTPLKPLDAVAQRKDIMGGVARANRREKREWLRNEMARKGASVLQWYELVRPRPQLLQMSWPEVEERVDRELPALTSGLEASKGTVVMEWEDGWTMQELPVECLDDEGQIMQHCVGRGGYDDAVSLGNTRIFSLRDPQNKPHVTTEYSVRDRRFIQVMGKQNKTPIPEYAARVKQFMVMNLDLFAPSAPTSTWFSTATVATPKYMESLLLVQDGLLNEDYEVIVSLHRKYAGSGLLTLDSLHRQKEAVHGIDFSGLRMVPTFSREVYDCNFDGCIFEGGRFADTVEACSFVGVELRAGSFSNGVFFDSTVSGCDFSGLKASVPQGRSWWSPAQFLGDFIDCSFRDADLSHVYWGPSSRIEGCDFTGAVKPPAAAEEMTENPPRRRGGLRFGAVEHSMTTNGRRPAAQDLAAMAEELEEEFRLLSQGGYSSFDAMVARSEFSREQWLRAARDHAAELGTLARCEVDYSSSHYMPSGSTGGRQDGGRARQQRARVVFTRGAGRKQLVI